MALKVFPTHAYEKELHQAVNLVHEQEPAFKNYFAELRARLKPTLAPTTIKNENAYRDPVIEQLNKLLKPSEVSFVVESLTKANDLQAFYQFSQPFFKELATTTTKLDTTYFLQLWGKFKQKILEHVETPPIGGYSKTATEYSKMLEPSSGTGELISGFPAVPKKKNKPPFSQVKKQILEQFKHPVSDLDKAIYQQLEQIPYEELFERRPNLRRELEESFIPKHLAAQKYRGSLGSRFATQVKQSNLSKKHDLNILPFAASPEYAETYRDLTEYGSKENPFESHKNIGKISERPEVHPEVKETLERYIGKVERREQKHGPSKFEKIRTVGGVAPPPANLTNKELMGQVRRMVREADIPEYEKTAIRQGIPSASSKHLMNAYAFLAHKPKLQGHGLWKAPHVSRR